MSIYSASADEFPLARLEFTSSHARDLVWGEHSPFWFIKSLTRWGIFFLLLLLGLRLRSPEADYFISELKLQFWVISELT